MSIFKKCTHDWEIIVNEYEKAIFEKLKDKITSVKNIPTELFQGKKIIILKCKKCGKLDKTIESV